MNMYLDDMNKNFDFDIARQNMLKGQILSCTQISADILNALEEIKRELFVIDKLKKFAFSDIRLELPHGQHMLKPLDEIRVLQELNITKTDKVLEIGTGSGYLTAILSKLASFVYSVEINQLNKQFANKNLSLSHCYNATIFLGNGLNGIPSVAPFDKIIITGAHHEIPDALKKQLNQRDMKNMIKNKNIGKTYFKAR